jgi:glutathione synthase/RimK-type ligase-like ATP-grasp enzyme
MSSGSILIVSTVADVATDAVVAALRAMGVNHTRVNTEDLPFDRSLTVDLSSDDDAQLLFDGRAATSGAIWYRRVRSPSRPIEMDEGIYDFCLRESRATLLGGLIGQNARWMSRPENIWRAEFKPYQLQQARSLGLRIPKTLVSNDPDAIRKAAQAFGPLVVKPARSGHFRSGNEEFAIFTSLLSDDHLAQLDDARWSPSIYQEHIPKRFDLRVTYVGGHLYSAAIHSQTDHAAEIDWRRTENPNLPHSPIEIDPTIARKLQELMKTLELEFGCIDLVLTPEGEYVFLEVNPSGQWLWIDDQLGLGISNGVARWLAGAPQ